MREESIRLSCIQAKVDGAEPLVYSNGQEIVLEFCEPRRECGFKAKLALRFQAIDSMIDFLEQALDQTKQVAKLYGYSSGDA